MRFVNNYKWTNMKKSMGKILKQRSNWYLFKKYLRIVTCGEIKILRRMSWNFWENSKRKPWKKIPGQFSKELLQKYPKQLRKMLMVSGEVSEKTKGLSQEFPGEPSMFYRLWSIFCSTYLLLLSQWANHNAKITIYPDVSLFGLTSF